MCTDPDARAATSGLQQQARSGLPWSSVMTAPGAGRPVSRGLQVAGTRGDRRADPLQPLTPARSLDILFLQCEAMSRRAVPVLRGQADAAPVSGALGLRMQQRTVW